MCSGFIAFAECRNSGLKFKDIPMSTTFYCLLTGYFCGFLSAILLTKREFKARLKKGDVEFEFDNRQITHTALPPSDE